MAKASDKDRPINLALQGGGAHGAFTWGVLDRLLEAPDVEIAAISGTSAGAMNAVAVADGLMRDGRDGARASLERFWRAVSAAAHWSPIRRGPIDVLMGNWSLDHNPGYLFFDMLNRVSSPYEFNPMNLNPLRDIVEEVIDFDLVRQCDALQLHVSATNVHTGRVKVFDGHALTSDMVMASACLPFMFQAVEIDGTPYWDGGYMGNPVLFPFYEGGSSRDIVIVQINPVERLGTPTTAREILNRVNEITINSSLLKELRAIEVVHALLDDGNDDLLPVGASSKVNGEWTFLRHLFDIGRTRASEWLDSCGGRIGDCSTVNVRALYQGAEQ